MKTAIVALAETKEAPCGFAAQLARILGTAGHPCTLIWAFRSFAPGTSQTPLPGVEVIYVRHSWAAVPQLPDFRLPRLAEQLAPILRQFDVVYSLLPGHPAMHAIRERRFSPSLTPIFVTVAEWVPRTGAKQDSELPGLGAARDFGLRYQVRHSDYLACTAQDHAEQLHAQNWILPAKERVRFVGKDPSQWLSLHREVTELARSSSSAGKPLPSATSEPAVTVCVPYFNQAEHLEAALESLTRQKSNDFSVTVVDDGSTSAESVQMFDRMHEKYGARGWQFLRQPSAGPGSARNLAAREAPGEYLLFLDADDLAPPRSIERMLQAARFSGEDALASWSWRIPYHGSVFEYQEGRVICAPDLLYTPIGNDEGFSSGPISLVRSAVFRAVGGFPVGLTAGFEDDDLRARIAQSGYSSDVIPEFLRFHRNTRQAFTEPTSQYWSHENIRRVRDDESDASSAMRRDRAAQKPIQRLAANGESRRLRLLMLISQWPYPPRSPAQSRWWRMIRYLGERHDLTLVTFMRREDEKTRQELLRFCRSIYAVGYGGAVPPEASSLPRQVRERQTLKMREAVQSAAKRSYDAALIEQIFLAPYREFIAVPTLMGEHNIESSLLAQAAEEEEAILLRQYEDRVWSELAVRTAVSQSDQREIQRRAGVGETVLVENGADPALRLERPRHDTNTVLFFAMFGRYSDLDAVLYLIEEIWPHVLRLNPSLRLMIIGHNPPDEITQLARTIPFELIEEFWDIGAIAARASVSIAPLRTGAGAQVRVLDSMALGLPVIATRRGCAGLSIEDGVHLLMRDDPITFAEAVDLVLKHRQLWETLRENGLRLIEQRYAWERVLDPLHRTLLEL
jgi:GT2 family glycosyltransferase